MPFNIYYSNLYSPVEFVQVHAPLEVHGERPGVTHTLYCTVHKAGVTKVTKPCDTCDCGT